MVCAPLEDDKGAAGCLSSNEPSLYHSLCLCVLYKFAWGPQNISFPCPWQAARRTHWPRPTHHALVSPKPHD
jgi:hypothetical protein